MHNAEARRERGTRERVARRLAPATASGDLVAQSFHAYREARVDEACETIAGLLVGDGTRTRWSRQEVAAALAEAGPFTFVPGPDLPAELSATDDAWSWGQSTARHLGDLTVDVLRRAVGLCPVDTDERAALVAARAGVHRVLAEIRHDRWDLAEAWHKAGTDLPARSGSAIAAQHETAALRSALPETLVAWRTACRRTPAPGCTARPWSSLAASTTPARRSPRSPSSGRPPATPRPSRWTICGR